MTKQLHGLSRWARLPASSEAAAETALRALTAGSLDRPARPPFGGLSFINADGLPFQWCLRLRPEGAGFAFLCEAGAPGTSARDRCAVSLAALRATLPALGVEWPTDLDPVLRIILPDAAAFPPHWRSAIWTGVAVGATGIALKPYFNLNRDTPRERWERLGHVLLALGRPRSLERLCEISGRVSRGSWPVGLAIDILPPGRVGRLKAYFRSQPGMDLEWLERWYSALDASAAWPKLRRLVDSFPCTTPGGHPPRSFFLGLEFHERDGHVSIKTDLSPDKWIGPADRLPCLRRSLLRLGIGDHDLGAALRAIDPRIGEDEWGGSVRLVGYGFEPDGADHVNVYLEPPLPRSRIGPRQASRDGPATGARRAVHCLVEALDGDHWSDFALPTGPSDSWVTAYVLTQVGGSSALDPRTAPTLDRVRGWLALRQRSDGGWAYSSDVASDADSTSWALRALDLHPGVDVRRAAIFMRRCQLDDGGIATYPDGYELGGAWARPSVDVTAAALLAPPHGGIRRKAALRWLASEGRVAGLWPSYWWVSPLYATALVLQATRGVWWHPPMAVTDALEAYRPLDPFETALLLICALRIGDRDRAEALGRSLMDAQLANGSWAASAHLRLTRPTVARPWATLDPGKTYVDEAGVFTTATVTGALVELSDRDGKAAASFPPRPR